MQNLGKTYGRDNGIFEIQSPCIYKFSVDLRCGLSKLLIVMTKHSTITVTGFLHNEQRKQRNMDKGILLNIINITMFLFTVNRGALLWWLPYYTPCTY